MTESSPEAMSALLIRELHQLLAGRTLCRAGESARHPKDSTVLIHAMAVSTGILLAASSDPAELGDSDSLTCRITPGDQRSSPTQWQYELIAGRYLSDSTIVFLDQDHAARQ